MWYRRKLSPVDKYQYFGRVRQQRKFLRSCNKRQVRSEFVQDAEWEAQVDVAEFSALTATAESKLWAACGLSSKQIQGICIRKSPQRSATLAAPRSRLRGHAWRAASPCYRHCPCQVHRTARSSPQTGTALAFWADTAREASEKQSPGISCVLKVKEERNSENQR